MAKDRPYKKGLEADYKGASLAGAGGQGSAELQEAGPSRF